MSGISQDISAEEANYKLRNITALNACHQFFQTCMADHDTKFQAICRNLTDFFVTLQAYRCREHVQLIMNILAEATMNIHLMLETRRNRPQDPKMALVKLVGVISKFRRVLDVQQKEQLAGVRGLLRQCHIRTQDWNPPLQDFDSEFIPDLGIIGPSPEIEPLEAPFPQVNRASSSTLSPARTDVSGTPPQANDQSRPPSVVRESSLLPWPSAPSIPLKPELPPLALRTMFTPIFHSLISTKAPGLDLGILRGATLSVETLRCLERLPGVFGQMGIGADPGSPEIESLVSAMSLGDIQPLLVDHESPIERRGMDIEETTTEVEMVDVEMVANSQWLSSEERTGLEDQFSNANTPLPSQSPSHHGQLEEVVFVPQISGSLKRKFDVENEGEEYKEGPEQARRRIDSEDLHNVTISRSSEEEVERSVSSAFVIPMRYNTLSDDGLGGLERMDEDELEDGEIREVSGHDPQRDKDMEDQANVVTADTVGFMGSTTGREEATAESTQLGTTMVLVNSIGAQTFVGVGVEEGTPTGLGSFGAAGDLERVSGTKAVPAENPEKDNSAQDEQLESEVAPTADIPSDQEVGVSDGEVEVVFSWTMPGVKIARQIFAFHVTEETYANVQRRRSWVGNTSPVQIAGAGTISEAKGNLEDDVEFHLVCIPGLNPDPNKPCGVQRRVTPVRGCALPWAHFSSGRVIMLPMHVDGMRDSISCDDEIVAGENTVEIIHQSEDYGGSVIRLEKRKSYRRKRREEEDAGVV